MKKIQTIALMMGIALTGTTGFSACSSSDVVEANPNVEVDENGQANVRPEFVISIPRTVVSATRMNGSLTQASGSISDFQGLDNIHLIPFAEVPSAASTKQGDVIRLSNIAKRSGLRATPNINYKVYPDQSIPIGTTNFLFYGKSIHQTAESAISDMSDKFKYGILNVKGISNSEFTTPGGISIQLVPIPFKEDSPSELKESNAGNEILLLLNRLANTSISGETAPHNYWSTTTDATLANLYSNFIKITVASSNSIAIILSRLYFSLGHVQSTSPARPLADELKRQIEEVCAKAPISGQPLELTSTYSNYPGDIGLPDGAARILWNAAGPSNSFSDITANYGNGNKIDITRYVYPPALWYYVNTPLKAADAKKSSEYDEAGNWAGVIKYVYKDAASVVSESTQSVALVNPVQYGVGRIETSIKMGAGPFYDRNGELIATGKYTLKGVLIGGQNSVNFDFTSKGSENQTIYDNVMSGDITITPEIDDPTTTEKTPNQTLALETKADQKIYLALELVNGGEDFAGADGIIPAGGTFYLTAELDPTKASNYKANALLDKIVIQDHVTQVKVTIKNGKSKDDPDYDPDDPEGMGDATNGIPDLSSPGIEVGTSVDLNWIEGLILNPSI